MNEITAYSHGVDDTQTELEQVKAQRDQLLKQVETLTNERNRAILKDNGAPPTEWAYNQACKALRKTKAQRDALLYALKRSLAVISQHYSSETDTCCDKDIQTIRTAIDNCKEE